MIIKIRLDNYNYEDTLSKMLRTAGKFTKDTTNYVNQIALYYESKLFTYLGDVI